MKQNRGLQALSDAALDHVTGGVAPSNVDPSAPAPPNRNQRMVRKLDDELRKNNLSRLVVVQSDEAARRFEIQHRRSGRTPMP